MSIPRTKIFFDTEFTGLHQRTTLISIGLISECGKEFYAEFTDYDKAQVEGDAWLQENVIAKLLYTDKIKPACSSWEYWISQRGQYEDALDFTLAEKDMANFHCIGGKEMVKNRLERWLSQFEQVEMWSDCLAYDWVLFCEIWRGAMCLPVSIHYIPFDLATLFQANGIDADISREKFVSNTFSESGEPLFFDAEGNMIEKQKHNALWDARVIKMCYEKLTQ